MYVELEFFLIHFSVPFTVRLKQHTPVAQFVFPILATSSSQCLKKHVDVNFWFLVSKSFTSWDTATTSLYTRPSLPWHKVTISSGGRIWLLHPKQKNPNAFPHTFTFHFNLPTSSERQQEVIHRYILFGLVS